MTAPLSTFAQETEGQQEFKPYDPAKYDGSDEEGQAIEVTVAGKFFR